MTNNIDKQAFAHAGAVILDETTTTAGDYCAVQVLVDGTILELSWPEVDPTGSYISLSDDPLPAGFMLYGQIKGVECTGGLAIAYRAVR